MQENNNFETIISKWRRISVVEKIEKKEALQSISMSGDSSNNQPFLEKKKEETHFLVPESKASTSLAIAEVGTVTSSELLSEKPVIVEEKQDLIKHEEEENKKTVGDGDRNVDDYLENSDKVIENAPGGEKKEKIGDNVDSVFLRSPPPHKTRSTPPTVEEEEDCGDQKTQTN